MHEALSSTRRPNLRARTTFTALFDQLIWAFFSINTCLNKFICVATGSFSSFCLLRGPKHSPKSKRYSGILFFIFKICSLNFQDRSQLYSSGLIYLHIFSTLKSSPHHLFPAPAFSPTTIFRTSKCTMSCEITVLPASPIRNNNISSKSFKNVSPQRQMLHLPSKHRNLSNHNFFHQHFHHPPDILHHQIFILGFQTVFIT